MWLGCFLWVHGRAWYPLLPIECPPPSKMVKSATEVLWNATFRSNLWQSVLEDRFNQAFKYLLIATYFIITLEQTFIFHSFESHQQNWKFDENFAELDLLAAHIFGVGVIFASKLFKLSVVSFLVSNNAHILHTCVYYCLLFKQTLITIFGWFQNSSMAFYAWYSRIFVWNRFYLWQNLATFFKQVVPETISK